jgi:hypothetical protein
MRQKHGSMIQVAFTAGGMVATLFYYLWESWQITTIFVVIIPSTLCLILMMVFLK